MKEPFVGNIEEDTINNKYFREVLFTGEHEQLVLMSLKPGEDIGEEVHDIDQFFRFESGQGKAILEGKEYELKDGVALVVPSGTKHNIINTSNEEPLQLYTIYSSQHHPEDAKFSTKEEAMNEEEHIEKAFDYFKHKAERRKKEKKNKPEEPEEVPEPDVYDEYVDDLADDELQEARANKFMEKATKVKMKDKTKKQTEKFDSCVDKVKANGDDVNPYAVCNVSVLGNTGETKKSTPLYFIPQDIIDKSSKKPDKPSISRKECPHCGAETQVGFDDVCWSCGKTSDDLEEKTFTPVFDDPKPKKVKPKIQTAPTTVKLPRVVRKRKIKKSSKHSDYRDANLDALKAEMQEDEYDEKPIKKKPIKKK